MASEPVRPLLSKLFVERGAALYNIANDLELFSDEFRQPIISRGYLTCDELTRIVAWKSSRQKTTVLKNVPETAEAVTREAFRCPEPWLAIWILCYLSAVQARVASAILTVYDPTRFTVMDARAWTALTWLGLLEPLRLAGYARDDPSDLDRPAVYAAYLEACRRLADDAGVSFRTLDRCLWAIGPLGPDVLEQLGAPT